MDAFEEGKAPVFFVCFRETLFKLEQVLQGMGLKVGRIVGEKKIPMRQSMRFQKE